MAKQKENKLLKYIHKAEKINSCVDLAQSCISNVETQHTS
jgi:hypothetical protein